LDVPFDQPVVLQETGSLPAKTIEVEGFDRLNMQVRRVWRKLQDVLTFNTDEAGASTGTADNLIGFDGSGDIAEIPNTTFLQTANDLSDVDAATARTNLGVDPAGTRFALSELTDSTITNPVSGETIEWNGSAWVNSLSNTQVDTSDTAPVSPNDGDLWYDSTSGLMYVYYNDGSSSQWVTITSAVSSLDASSVAYTPAGTGAVVTDLQTKLRESVSVKDFGAAGDGVTDDTTKIQAAFDSGATSVYFPAGSYLCNSRLFITSTIHCYGHNSARIIFPDSLTYGTVETTGAGDIDVIDVTDISFKGLIFESRSSTSSINIHFRGCSDVVVSGCEFNRPNAADGSKSVVIQRSPNVSQVINISILGNQFIEAATACLVIGEVAEPPTNIVIDSNIVDSNSSDVDSGIKVDKYCNNVVISNNTVNGNGFMDSGITVEQGSNQVLVTGNTIKNYVNRGIKLSTDNNDTPVAFTNVVIANNGIYEPSGGGSGFGIYLDSTGATSDNVTISNNMISGAATGIREELNNITTLSVINNQILDSTTEGMQIRSDFAVVMGNVVRGAASIYSWSTNTATSGLHVVDNVFDQNNGNASSSVNYGGSHQTDITVARNKGLLANSERATGTFTLSSAIEVTEIYSSAGAVTGTLPDGDFAGQIKTIHHSSVGSINSSTVSVTNHATSDPEVITFATRNATAVLMWMGNEWITLTLSGATV